MLYALFTLTIFLGSALLFLVQPMVAKMILPSFGGAPAVWNTALVFFQAALLAGYGYAHLGTKLLGVRKQPYLHLALVAAALFLLPMRLPDGYNPAHSSLPTSLELLSLLVGMVGLPFVMVSAGAPLVQRWFGATGHRQAADPYFLYAASNLGSILGLLAYPFVIEARMDLRSQAELWTWGYRALFLMLLLSATATLLARHPKPQTEASPPNDPSPIERTAAQPARSPTPTSTRLSWIALAAVPASLLLGVTNFLSTNVAAVPMLWVVPLTLYLLTYVIAFSRRRFVPTVVIGRIAAILLAPIAVITVQESNDPLWLLASLHLLFFFVASLYCHSRLADSRPQVERLTEFYLLLSLGGVLGGAFNALFAPVAFETILEYPLAIAAVAALRQPRVERKLGIWDFAYPAIVAAVTWGAISYANATSMDFDATRIAVTIGLPVLVAFLSVDYPLRSGLAFAAFFVIAGIMHPALSGDILRIERSFFGVHRVTLSHGGALRNLIHGNTIHGRQWTDPARAHEPLTYYHRTGPIGQVFDAFQGQPQLEDVALVGLGVGSLAAYGEPGTRMTYYEIDPLVVEIASETRYFTFLANCRAELAVVLGDARLSLAKERNGRFGLIVLDAFSSDAIPVHLITREAIRMYLEKLRPGGLLAFHISNRYLDLESPLASAARDLGLATLKQFDVVDDETEERTGKTSSHYLLMARSLGDFGRLAQSGKWQPAYIEPGLDRAWTDDYSNVLSVWKEHE